MYRPISEVLRSSGILVFTTTSATVAEAAERMAFHNVGSILVMDHSHELAGIFTERDLLNRVVVKGLDPKLTPISDVMTRDVLVMSKDTPRGEVREIMRTKHIRHIPVADGEKILGVVSLRDVLRIDNQEKDFEIDKLKEYVMHKPYPIYPG